MWQMSDKVRVFTDGEWELFAEGLAPLFVSVEHDFLFKKRNSKTGVPVFDALTSSQQVALLADVATALCEPTVRAPAHTLAKDGAVAAAFSQVRELLKEELGGDLDAEDGMRVRKLIRAAFPGRGAGPQKLPPPTRENYTIGKG